MEETPYPVSLYEAQKRIPELFEKEFEKERVDFDGNESDLRKQIAISLYLQSKKEWEQLCKDDERLIQSHRSHTHFRIFWKELMSVDECIEEILLRLILSDDYDILYKAEEETKNE